MTTISDIIKRRGKGHGLGIFEESEVKELEKGIFIKRRKPYIRCFVSDVERQLTPEEIIRQLFARRLVYFYGYPKERLGVEVGIQFGSNESDRRADIVVHHERTDEPLIIVEVKKPKRKDGEKQLKSYSNANGSPIAVWSNGEQVEVWYRKRPNNFLSITSIPTADQTLEHVISESWTIDRLTKENKLITEKKSLREIIKTLEDLVLVNSAPDAFEEAFKLVYTKLYDEWAATNIQRRNGEIHFRIHNEDPEYLYEKINNLFHEAKNKWRDVFNEFDKIELTPEHLETCVSFLQDIKLFNSNLYVIDEAFEYLITKNSKGEKGQYFTPRHVIDMCVKMLNPKEDEYMIDPASGSCGFTVHTVFHIAKEQFTNQKLPDYAREFAQNNVYAIDLDTKATKVSKAMNLIAGDGKSNVYQSNSLDGRSWNDDLKHALKQYLVRFRERSHDDENQRTFKSFSFDILMTNPPFAGKQPEPNILRQYTLAKNKKGKITSSVKRDTLFLERAFSFIKDGGRFAIVLPQGKFNNTKEERIRKYIIEHGRILAVIGLDANTFKPHTGTKTSVLFVQKWHKSLCPRKDNYPIFFATSQKTGKDSSGRYLFLKDERGEPDLDLHGHPKIDHDLEEVANQFLKFAKEQKFSFVE